MFAAMRAARARRGASDSCWRRPGVCSTAPSVCHPLAADAGGSTSSRIARAISAFAAPRHVPLAVGGDDRDLVVGATSKPMPGRDDVVDHDRVEPLALELVAPVGRPRRSPCSAAKPTSIWSGRRRAASAPSTSSVRLELERRAPRRASFLSLRSAGARGPEVGDRGGHQQHVAARRTRPRRPPASSAAVSHVDVRDAGRRVERDVGGDRPSPRRRGAAASSASAKPIRPDERLPTKRTLSIGSRVPPAVTSTLQPVQRRRPAGERASTAASSSAGSASRPMPVLAVRARARPCPGRCTVDAARAQQREVGLGRRVLVHAVVHRRRDEHRAARRRARRVVSRLSARPWASLAIVFAVAGAIRKTSARSTSARWLIGACVGRRLAGVGAARRVGLELARRSTGAPVIAANDAAPTKRWLARRLDHAHGVAGLDRQPRELERLVGRDPAADSEEQPRHLGVQAPPGLPVVVLELALATSSSAIVR